MVFFLLKPVIFCRYFEIKKIHLFFQLCWPAGASPMHSTGNQTPLILILCLPKAWKFELESVQFYLIWFSMYLFKYFCSCAEMSKFSEIILLNILT
jgi:hypothetical protein